MLQDVVAKAMTSDEPIDMEQFKVMVFAELDAPHIRALTRLAEAVAAPEQLVDGLDGAGL